MNRKIFIFLIVAMVIVFGFAGARFAVASTNLDAAFKPVLATPGVVRGIAPLPDKKIVIIGDFSSVNGVPCKKIARLNMDGSVDSTFHPTAAIDMTRIDAVAVQSDGKILIGGYLTHFGETQSQRYLFRLNTDGSWDESFSAGGYVYKTATSFGIDNVVRTIQIDSSGKILVGGDFTLPRHGIARLNSDGTEDTTFDPGTGANGSVSHIVLQSSGQIIIGGSFTSVNKTAKVGIARLTSNGDLDATAFGAGVSGGSVLALAVQSDDKVLVAGNFSAAAGADVSKIARFLADGTLDSSFAPIINSDTGSMIGSYLEEITSLAAYGDYLFVGGWNPVMYFNGRPTGHNATIYTLRKDTGHFVSYVPFQGKPTDVWALAKRSDGSIVAGGSFTRLDGISDQGLYPGLCRLTGEYFQPDASFRPVVGGQANVNTLTVHADGKIVVGGDFYLAEGVPRPGVARFNSDGSLDQTFTPPVTAGGTVADILLQDDGKLVIGGSFYSIAGDDYKDIALLSTAGIVEASAYVGGVKSLAWYPGGKIIAVTSWSPGIKRLSATLAIEGEADFNPGGGISNSQQPDYEFDRANTAAVQPDGKILVGGSFSSFNGIARQNIVRLNADGSVDAGFVSPSFTVFNFRSEIFSIALQPDGKIIVAGRFSTVGGVASPSIARLNANGTVDATFHSPFGDTGSTAYKVYVQPDGKILVGGEIQLIDGANIYNGLVRLNADGSRDVTFNVSLAGAVKRMFLYPATSRGASRLLVGGLFDAVNETFRAGLARFLLVQEGLGDVDHDSTVTLSDAIRVLRMLVNAETASLFLDADVNNDQRIGLEEAIYILQTLADL